MSASLAILPDAFDVQAQIYIVYVRTKNAVQHVLVKLDGAVKDFMSTIVTNSDSSLTFDGYKMDMVQKLLQLKYVRPVTAPSGETEFLSWLDE